jgi:Zn-dependent M16 (insulinase) family peptidase
MHPDTTLLAEETKQEHARLQEVRKSLSLGAVEEILKQSQDLAVYQKQTEQQVLDCLPKVTLGDVSPIARDFLLKQHRVGNLTVYHHDCFTNHIVYADLIFDLPHIEDQDLAFVHLFTSLIPEIGSGKRSYAQNLEYIQAHTGGIGASCALHIQTEDPKQSKPSFNLRGKALDRKMDKLFLLMRDTLLHLRLDEKSRIEELVMQLRDAQLNRLNRQAMRYAIQLAMSGFSPAAHVSEAWYGLRYYKTIEQLSKNKSSLMQTLDRLKKQLFTLHDLHLVLSCSKEMFLEIQKNGFYGLAELAPKPCTPWTLDYPVQQLASQARTIASQVAFNAEAFKTVTYLHPFAPALTVAAVLFDNKILHRRIREQGGAYGCGATYSSSLGYFNFHSFRDPHIADSIKTFGDAIAEVASGKFTEQDLEEAKLGVIQQFDTPISPGSRGLAAYSWRRDGKTKEMRQAFREHLLGLTPKDLQHAVEMELLPKIEQGVTVCFAGKELIEKEKLSLPIYPI